MKRMILCALALTMILTGCLAKEEGATPTATRLTQTSTTELMATTASTTSSAVLTTTESSAEETTVTSAVTSTTALSTTTAKITTRTTTTAAKATTTTTKKITTTKKTTTTTKKTTTTTAPNDTDVDAIAQYMTTLINRERAAVGAPPLTCRTDLQQYADIRADEIVELFSHTRPDGTECFTVFEELGHHHFWAMGENIAYGQRLVEAVMQAWMDSEGHRANILSTDFNGVIIGFNNYHWVQLFVYE